MRSQQGYVLISLTLMLFLIASVSLVLNREGSMHVTLSASENSVSEAQQVAIAGLNHLLWRANQQDCSGYTDIPLTSFSGHSYNATIAPDSGSPVHVTATSLLSNGSSVSVEREQQAIYQPVKPAVSITTADGDSKDTYVTDYWLSRGNQGSDDLIYSYGNFFGAQAFTLFEFDLTGLPLNIVVTEAELSVNLKQITIGSGSPEVSIHRMMQEWTEFGSSYTTSDGSTAWNSWPPPMDPDAAFTSAISSSDVGINSWDVTRLVQGWLDGDYPNYGLSIASSSAVSIISMETKEESSPTLIPTLTIRYTCECGTFCDSGAPPPGGLAYWKLDENSGNLAEDSMGDNDGTTIGPNWTTGQIDGAASFNGTTDYINVPHSDRLSFEDEMSISAWINPSRFITGLNGYQTIVSKGTSDNTEEYWFGLWQDQLEFGILDQGAWSYVTSISADIELDTWYHVVLTFSDSTDEVRLYLDGSVVGSGTLTKNLLGGTDDLQIGRSLYGEHWNGLLDDIQLFDVVLSPEEVLALTEAGGKTIPYRVLDQFNTRTFDGDNGNVSWSDDWQEIGESDGPTSGDVQVRSNSGRDYVVRLRDNDNGGEGIQRRVDISSCQKAALSYEYRRVGLDGSGDNVQISISGDGGSSWDNLAVVAGPASDGTYNTDSFDISSYISSNTTIRFQTSSSMGGNDVVYFDNIEIELGGCN